MTLQDDSGLSLSQTWKKDDLTVSDVAAKDQADKLQQHQNSGIKVMIVTKTDDNYCSNGEEPPLVEEVEMIIIDEASTMITTFDSVTDDDSHAKEDEKDDHDHIVLYLPSTQLEDLVEKVSYLLKSVADLTTSTNNMSTDVKELQNTYETSKLQVNKLRNEVDKAILLNRAAEADLLEIRMLLRSEGDVGAALSLFEQSEDGAALTALEQQEPDSQTTLLSSQNISFTEGNTADTNDAITVGGLSKTCTTHDFKDTTLAKARIPRDKEKADKDKLEACTRLLRILKDTEAKLKAKRNRVQRIKRPIEENQSETIESLVLKAGFGDIMPSLNWGLTS